MDQNLQDQIRQSDEHFTRYQDALTRKRAFEPDPDLQVRIEDLYLHRMAAQATGPVERYNALDQEYRSMVSQRDRAAKSLDNEIAAAEQTLREDNYSFILGFKRWAQTIQSAVPKDVALAEYVQGSCREIDGMVLRPLGEILQAIQEHRRKIQSWQLKD